MGREDSMQLRLKFIPEQHQSLYRRALSGTSPSAGIRARCRECFGWDTNVIKRVRLCPDFGCPLHAFRTGPSKPLGEKWKETQTERMEEVKEEIPENLHTRYEKVLRGKSRVTAILVYCAHCVGGGVGFRREIRECGAVGCPLHPYRPGNDRKSLPKPPEISPAGLDSNKRGAKAPGKVRPGTEP